MASKEFDQLVQQVQDLSDVQQEHSDTLESLGDTVSTHDDSISELDETAGHLGFPLAQEDADLINELFPRGRVTLVAGTATLIDDRISPTSVILYSVETSSGIPAIGFTVTLASLPFTYSAPQLAYSVVLTPGKAVFTSSIATDTSTLMYELLP